MGGSHAPYPTRRSCLNPASIKPRAIHLILTGGVDTSWIRWVDYDGIGRAVRNGLNFTERGFGVRRAVGVSDRGNTAAAQLRAGDINWDGLFGEHGVRWFHTGGIYAGLSTTTPEVLEEAMSAAKNFGTIISYDLNYGPASARESAARQPRKRSTGAWHDTST